MVDSPSTIRATLRWPDGQLTSPRTLSDAAIGLGTWADPAGNMGVSLERDTDPGAGTTIATEAHVFDSAGPAVKVTGPATGAAGQALAFEATAFDVWSSVAGPVSWAFSGGGTASGASVTNAFAAGGRQSATATATDSLGNATSAVAELDVSGPAAPAPSPSGDADAGQGHDEAIDREAQGLVQARRGDAEVHAVRGRDGQGHDQAQGRQEGDDDHEESSRPAAARSRRASSSARCATRSRSSPLTPPRTRRSPPRSRVPSAR